MARKLLSHYAVFENVSGTRDLAFYYQEGGADTVTGVAASEADYIVDLLRHEKPMGYDHSLKRLSTLNVEPVGETEILPDLDAWLNAHPAVAGSLVWADAMGPHPWSVWSGAWKAELRSAFAAAWAGGSISVPEVPVNQATLADDESATTVLRAQDAWAYFKASVALSLAVEIGQSVPWRLTTYNGEQLAQLFDSREMFHWQLSPLGYRLQSSHGHVLPAPPARSRQFLTANDLLGVTRVGTLGRVLEWCRGNLVHFSGGFTAANVEDQWQYRGFPPMTRIFDGTVKTSNPNGGLRHRTAGCWGTVGFLRALLRVANIPVKLVSNAGHAQPWFMADSRYLTHGDDPYNALTKCTPPYPAGELLIDQAKFDAWFGAGVSDTDKGNNIGRRTRELSIVYLPNYLLHQHCGDVTAGRSHAESDVFETLSRNYTVGQLEAEQLWERMDDKIAGFGGCAHVPA